MPSSLRLLIGLVALCMVTAVTAFTFKYVEDTSMATTDAEAATGGSVRSGKARIVSHGCAGCHAIPGIRQARGEVGPPLKGLAARTMIAGRLANTPDNLVRWLRHPQSLVPGNAMPDQGLDEQQARDIAAYLYAQR